MSKLNLNNVEFFSTSKLKGGKSVRASRVYSADNKIYII